MAGLHQPQQLGEYPLFLIVASLAQALLGDGGPSSLAPLNTHPSPLVRPLKGHCHHTSHRPAGAAANDCRQAGHRRQALPAKYYGQTRGALNAARQIAFSPLACCRCISPRSVVYCANTACQNSPFAGQALRDLGPIPMCGYKGAKQDWIDARLAVESRAKSRRNSR